MILEILKLNGSVLTRTFLFQTHKSAMFKTCAKPYKKGNEQGTSNDTSRHCHVAKLKHRDVARIQNPTATFTSRRCHVATLARPYVAMSPHRDVGMLRRWECLTQTSCQVTSRQITSHHVTSRRNIETSRRFGFG